ncbi:MAG: hypothetical protein RJA61_614 [Candidatus Parcubacteria bacterium]|jgi:cell division protein FtsI/penicillin-binding protein 2
MKARFTARVQFLSACIIIFALILVGKLYFVQIVSGEEYSAKADRQYSKPSTSLFSRGSIFFTHKDGQLFTAATLKACFVIAVNPNTLENPLDVWEKISPFLSIEKEYFLERALKAGDPYEEIAKKVETKEAEAIQALGIKGIIVQKDNCRFYPAEKMASNTVGIVAFKEDEYAGRYGLERYYEDVLVRDTTDSYQNFFAEIFTNIKETLFKEKPLEGNIVTSIEFGTQMFLEKKLEEITDTWSSEFSGGIVMDPKTGEVVAMAVNPTFNPNALEASEVLSFGNPLVESVYEMGSIIKPLTVASGIDAGVITSKTTYKDEGFLVLNTARISNYDGKGRGVVDMQTVLSKSLNTGVAFVVSKLGNKAFADYFKSLDMGEETGIDLPNETRGLIDNLDSTRDIEYATASYGQGIALTPIGTVRALSTLANGGSLPSPHIAKEIHYSVGVSKEISTLPPKPVFKKETAEEVTRMLVSVVDTALLNGKIKNPRYSVAAKTGTAQIAKPEGGGYYTDRFLHSFFGYFPAYDPQFIVFLYTVYPKKVEYASETLTQSFADITQFLIHHYEIPPDR